MLHLNNTVLLTKSIILFPSNNTHRSSYVYMVHYICLSTYGGEERGYLTEVERIQQGFRPSPE